MSILSKFQTYATIIQHLQIAGSATKKEILAKLDDKEVGVKDRTFWRLKDELRDYFGYELVYQNSAYVLLKGENPMQFMLWRMIELLKEAEVLEGTLKSHDHRDKVLFDEAETPSFYSFLPEIFDAIIQKKKVSFDYHFFHEDQIINVSIEPYMLKEYLRRWYVIGHSSYKEDIRTYGLDRITNLNVSDETFKFSNYSEIATRYSEVVGLNYSGDLQRVVLKVRELQANYLRGLKLHVSQKEIEEKNDWVYFEYHLRPNFEFQQRILMLGDQVEVIEPETLKSEIKSRLQNTLALYK